MRYKLGKQVTVDVCGGRFPGKIVDIKKDWTNEVLYEVIGDRIITSVPAKSINVKGQATCIRTECSFREGCSLLKIKG